MPTKAKFSEPCTHCGICCQTELCTLGQLVFPSSSAPCPGILQKQGKIQCGLVLMETAAHTKPLFATALGIGCGCSMPDPDTTEAEIQEFDKTSKEKMKSLQPSAQISGSSVQIAFPHAGVDRPCTYGIQCENPQLQNRLAEAINAGAVTENPEIRKDNQGKSYVAFSCKVIGRYLSSMLQKLGF